MAFSIKFSFLLMFMTLSIPFSSSSPSSFPPFLHDLTLQCPNSRFSSSPIQMDGESLDRLLSSSSTNTHIAVLFYASWCPFSRNALPKFSALATMYPQIKHVTLEQSLVLPSVFSRYGIHSVPSILIVNRTSRAQHRAPKDLRSLLNFYQRTTGLEPTVYLTEDQIASSEARPRVLESWNITSMKDILSGEPYLAFSFVFIFIKAFVYLCPDIVSNVIALWAAYIPRLNLAIFGESKQLLARALNLVDIKRSFSRLKLSKSRNFHNGARSARVLASSLASVSLGETSSARA